MVGLATMVDFRSWRVIQMLNFPILKEKLSSKLKFTKKKVKMYSNTFEYCHELSYIKIADSRWRSQKWTKHDDVSKNMYLVFAIIDEESVIGFSQLKIISSCFFLFAAAILSPPFWIKKIWKRIHYSDSKIPWVHLLTNIICFFFRLSHCHFESTILNVENLITDS